MQRARKSFDRFRFLIILRRELKTANILRMNSKTSQTDTSPRCSAPLHLSNGQKEIFNDQNKPSPQIGTKPQPHAYRTSGLPVNTVDVFAGHPSVVLLKVPTMKNSFALELQRLENI